MVVRAFTNSTTTNIDHNDLNVGIDKVFDLSEAADGHKYLEAGKSKGKVLYKV